MPAVKTKFPGLTGNQLKILAMAAMTLDHVGVQLFPDVPILRILGRLALPIYAWMIAEGCRHTHDRRKYLLRLASMAALCQLVYYFAMGSLYQCILVTFSLSVASIYALEDFARRNTLPAFLLDMSVFLGVVITCQVLPDLIPGFDIDYGILGVLLPLVIYSMDQKWSQLLFCGAMLVALAFHYGGVQWYALAALPLLALYNGKRGKANIGPLFYWYYPAHLVVIYGISLLI